jgi:hypothetical protein
MEQLSDVVLGAAIGGCITYIFGTIAFGKQIAKLDARLESVESTLAAITQVTVREA